MSRFYTNPSDVSPGTTIRSDKYNSDKGAIDTGFESVAGELDKTLQLPSTFTGDNVIPAMTTTNTFLGVDSSGDLTFFPKADLDTAITQAQASAAQSASSSTTAQTARDEAVSARDAAVTAKNEAQTASAAVSVSAEFQALVIIGL